MLPLTTLVLAAAAGASPVLRAERVDKPPVVDGSLDDAAWKKATASSKFTQKLPDDGKAPSEPTHVRIVYDDKAIYIAVDCIQKTSEIVAPLSRRDREVETDSVTVALATRGDGTTAFEFSINPAGVLADATRFDDTSSSRDWDENWTGSAKKTATGWSAEIEIPLRILRFEERAEQSFGLQVRRYTSARKESDEWAHIPRSDSGEVSKYGRLENLVGLKKGSAFEVRPFVVGKIGSRDTDLAPLSRGFSPGFSAGADFKWLLLPSLTLDGAILPDFGQVEADKVVLNLSSFETYFPEKRPFFLEAADIFQTPLQLVYTRRIGRAAYLPELPGDLEFATYPDPSPIYGALKLTGNLGEGWSVGALLALSGGSTAEAQRPSELVLDPNGALHATPAGRKREYVAEPLTAYKVLRLRRNFSGGSSLGVMMTGVSRLESSSAYPQIPGPGGERTTLCPGGEEVPPGQRCFHNAYTLGVDGKYRFLGGDFSLGGQVVGSLIEGGPEREQRDGNFIRSGDVSPGGKIQLKKEGGGHIRLGATYSALGKTLDFNDLGYMQRQNYMSADVFVEYDTNGPFSRFNDGFLGVYVWDNETLDFLNAGRGAGIFAGVQLKNTWRFFTEINVRADYQDDREVEEGASLERAGGVELNLGVDTDGRKPVSAGVFVAPRLHTNGAFTLYSDATLKARPLPQLELDLVPNFTYTLGEPRYFDKSDSGGDYLFGKLEAASLSATLSGTYTFLPTLTLQVYGQAFLAFGRYTDFTRHPVLEGQRPQITLAALRPTAAPGPDLDPNFTSGTFNANVVLRWEYRLGSLVYVVYTHSQSDGLTPLLREAGQFDFKLVAPRNAADVFLLKASYWWG